MGHAKNGRIVMSDAEIITTALVAAKFFGGNHRSACSYLKEHEFMPKMLSKSRFLRRLHRLFVSMVELFDCLGIILKSLNEQNEHLLDSFPVPLCDNIRIPNG